MKKTLFLTLVGSIVICLSTFSQRIIIHGKETDRKLEWSDFKGKVDMSSSYWAHTAYTIKYRYDNVKFNGEMATIVNFELSLELDPERTWARTEKISDELLIHEQGHFDIGILCAKEIMAIFNKTSFNKSDFSEALKSMVSETIRKYNEMGVQYDRETEHFRNKEQQEKWNSLLAEKLAK